MPVLGNLKDRLSQAYSGFFNPVDSELFSALTMGTVDTGRRALLPEWYFAAPYGQPRSIDVTELRELSETPFVHMCIKTIVDDFATTPWDVVPKDPHSFNQAHVDTLKEFLNQPNQNKETLADIKRQWAYDVLYVDAGVIVKVFSNESHMEAIPEERRMTYENKYYKKGRQLNEFKSKRLVNVSKITESEDYKDAFGKAFKPLKPRGSRKLLEIYSRDGSTFLADGDMTGFVHRYFQYSFKLPYRIPQIFDRDEIVYSMQSPRSYSFYGWSPVQSLEDVVRTLKEAVIYSLTGFKEKGVPDGLLSILDISKTELERLREYWQKEIKGKYHKFGVIGREAKFTPIRITAKDMEMIAIQQWFVKLAMAVFNVDIPMLSLRGEAPRAGTWAIMRRERQKAILPLIQLWDHEMNAEILSEFGFDDVEFKSETYDLDEDKIKRDMQINDIKAGIATINEVRQQERGLDPVAWGEEPFQPGIHALRTGGFPMTQFPKYIGTEEPTWKEFKEITRKVK